VREGVTKTRRGAAAILRQGAERVVDVPVGAALVARDAVTEAVEPWTKSTGRERELRKYERRGGQARRKATRRVRSTRSRVERELKARRREVTRNVKQGQAQVEKTVKQNRGRAEEGLRKARSAVSERGLPLA
jgi:guanylate kinase